MPRFFFHVDDGISSPDLEGTELSCVEEARAVAVATSGAILRDLNGGFWGLTQQWRMHVTDEAGNRLFSLEFTADVSIGTPKRH